MANVEHSALTGSNLHEPKGANTAAVSTVYVSDGVGSGAWSTLGVASLASTAKAFQSQLFHVREAQASGTNGGTFTGGAWRTRTLNSTVVNQITSASLASNQITLPAGTYYIDATAPANMVGGHKAKLFNVTDSTDTMTGSSEYSDSSGNNFDGYAVTRSRIVGQFTIAGAKTFEIRHISQVTRNTSGFGCDTTSGLSETFTEVLIWKVA